MGRLFKYLGWLIGLVLLLVIAAVVVLPMVVDPNDFKDQIIAKVEQEAGRSLKIEGDLELSVFPWLGIEIADLELGNAKGFGPEPFAAVKQAAVRVKLMPLLKRELVVDTIGLDGLKLNLGKTRDGHTNWADLEKRFGSSGEGSGTAKEGVEQGKGLDSLAIGGIDISDARVTWQDRQKGEQLVVENFNFRSGAFVVGRPVDLQLGFLLKRDEPPFQARITLEGQVTVNEAQEQARIKGLRFKLVAEGEEIPDGGMELELASDVRYALDSGQLEVSGLELSSGGLRISGELRGENLAESPRFSGKLALAELNLREWLQQLGLEERVTADPAVLSRFSARAVFTLEGGVTSVHPLDIKLDDSQLNGALKVAGSAVAFDLKLDTIDLDRYLPPPEEDKSGKKTADAGLADTGELGELIPVETLRQLDLDGVLSVGWIKIMNLKAEQIALTVKAKDGRLTLDKQIKKFYQGSYNSNLGLDVRGKAPLIRVDTGGSGIVIGSLLKDLSGEDRLTGKGRFGAKLNTQGNSIEAIKAALGGKLDFRFEDGAVKGFNLAHTIRQAKARFKGEPLLANEGPVQTDFSEIGGSAVIDKGILDNRDLLAKSPYLRVTGAGKVNLVKEMLDYMVKVVIVSSAEGKGGKDLKELEGIPVPIHLTGSYLSPKLNIEWGEVLTATQKAKLEQKKEKYQQKLEKKLEKKLFKLFN